MRDVAKQHQLKIARSTMKMHCMGAWILGGMDHVKAAELLGTSKPQDCTCDKAKPDQPNFGGTK